MNLNTKKMKKELMLVVLACMNFSVFAQKELWQNPKVNEVNRLPMHTSYFAYESDEVAKAGDKEMSANFMSLNGIWKFNWVKDAWLRPVDFFKTTYDDKSWGTMPVPGNWELNGYGDPIYVNAGYPWRNQYANNPPTVPEENNHVGTYRKEIELPKGWTGKNIIAHFGSVTSNISLYVNGKYVGYSEDSKLAAEFDLTKYLKPGKNLIAFQVFRWCDGSYLEDQDFWRFSGVGRDCYLYAREKTYIKDIQVTPDLINNYTDGKLDVSLDIIGGASVDLVLTDKKGEVVTKKSISGSGNKTASIEVADVNKWSAELPYLYTLTATLKKGSVVKEVIPLKVGFRKVEMKNAQLLVNGQPILIKGVNRHELDPDGGYVVSKERMIEDIQLMKKFNVNAVRTCHYPDDELWYSLCDEYGIYMVAEANVESHGMGYGDQTLAKNPLYDKAHLERNQRNVQRNYNHPAVIIWSLGNEAGFGPNFEACYKWIKAYDTSRPVQYEQGHGNEFTDTYCPMYLDYKRSEEYCQKEQTKPLIQCEYAHAMGNSMGGFKEYWDLIRKYPLYQGGFIWDFVNQSIRWTNKDGQEIYAYGGDFNAYDGSDNNFLNNGLISPDRVPNPHFYEVGYFYQSIWTKDADIKAGKIEVTNEYFFRDLSNFYLQWDLVSEGKVVSTGFVNQMDVAPQKTERIDLGLEIPECLQHSKELFVNVSYKLKKAEQLLPAGYTLAKEQLTVKEWESEAVVISNKKESNQKVSLPEKVDNDYNYLIIKGENFRIDINRHSGFLSRYEVNNTPLLEDGAELKPNFWRAPTDNDYGAQLQQKYRAWHHPKMDLKSFDSSLEDGMVKAVAKYEMPGVKAELVLEYVINNEGAIKVTQKLKANSEEEVSEMFRFGLKMQMPADFDLIEYYGRGPVENYVDRKYSEFVGLYNQTVCEQTYPYIRPQETGTKSDIRYWKQVNKAGFGLEFISDNLFSASALNYTIDGLDDGWDKDQRHMPEVDKTEAVNICIDKMQLGLGCVNSWRALPLKQYRIPYQDYEFTFLIKPISK